MLLGLVVRFDMEWYELEEEERIKQVYSKYKLEDFWKWWSGGQNKVMEVRIKDKDLIKETATKFNLRWSYSGVYVWNHILLKKVVSYVRDKATVWFGVNPRKQNWNPCGRKSFGGKDVNIAEIGFIFIDIDRTLKDGVAEKQDLEHCNELANKILARLETQGWNKSYLKICSGHGVQLIIKLDFSIRMPELIFDSKTKTYEDSEAFDKFKNIIRLGIGRQIVKFSKKFSELKVDIDASGFNIGRVAALPVTKNFKYNTFRWRGIVQMANTSNSGLSDYVLSKEEDLKLYHRKNVFSRSSSLLPKNRLRPGKLMEHEYVKFLLKNEFPEGMRNNYLWFQLKCLLRDSKIDLSSSEYKKLHRLLEKKFSDSLASNLPDKKFTFDENIVNSYCIKCLLPPLYELWPNKTKKVDMCLDKLSWKNLEVVEEMKLSDDTTIMEDLKMCREKLTEGDFNNVNVVASFLKGCLIKYGEEKARYYYEYLFKRYFNYC